MAANPTQITYVVVRPTFEHGDHTCTATLNGYEEVQLRVGFADEPSRVKDFYETFGDALADALKISKLAGVALWYDGHEVLTRVTGKHDLLKKLSSAGWTYPARTI